MGKAVGYCEGCFLAKSDSEDESNDHETTILAKSMWTPDFSSAIINSTIVS